MEYPVRCLISSPGTVIFVCDRYHGAFPRRTDVHLEPRALGHTCCMQARTTSYRAPLSSVRHGHPAAGHCCAPLSGPGLRRTRHELQGAIAQVRGAISPAPDSAGVALIRPPTGGMAAWCSSEKIVSDGTIAKHHSTRGSRVIPQRSTSLAQPCLTSEIGRDRVCSEWYDRGIQFTPSPPPYRLQGSPPSTATNLDRDVAPLRRMAALDGRRGSGHQSTSAMHNTSRDQITFSAG